MCSAAWLFEYKWSITIIFVFSHRKDVHKAIDLNIGLNLALIGCVPQCQIIGLYHHAAVSLQI